MTKSILTALLLTALLTGTHAGQASAAADKTGAAADKSVSTAQTDTVREMLSAITEIGVVLENRHVVYEAGTLKDSVLDAVIAAIDPEGGAILTKEQAQQRQDEEKGIFYGIGCKLRINEKWPKIAEVVSNSPAAAAGLRANDLIVKIGGHSTENMALDAVIQLLRGGKDETLELAVRAGEKTAEDKPNAEQARTVKLTRSAIQTPITGAAETWPQGIGYLKINGLYTNSGAVIIEQLYAWQATNCFGVILDMRGAEGMDLESVTAIGSLFARAGDTLFLLRDGHNNAVAAYQAKAASPMNKAVMILIDQDTSGAAEVLAGLLSVCKGAMLIGAPTRGDDRIRSVIPLAGDRVLYIATQRIELGQGPAYYQKGIAPHVRVASTNPAAEQESVFIDEEPDIFTGISEQERQDRALIKRVDGDVILRRAVDILLGLKALDFKVRQ